ncbi:MAG: TonB-dependent receptor [Gemmatimonadaceae bacterium]|nr:TonB-dependent receptor [Gemmatimonadaceae bacterium]
MIRVFMVVVVQALGDVRGTVRDGVTGLPVSAARVTVSQEVVSTEESGRFALTARIGDTLRVRRIGYRQASIVIGLQDSLVVHLQPLALQVAQVDVRAPAAASRHIALVEVRSIETEGVTSSRDLATRLPFVSARSSRSGVALSMRGSRPEQVLVLLDGVPLNDPATGAADMSDLPIAALGGVAVIPGASAATLGSGASGGVLALSSGAGSTLTASISSHSRAGLSAAHTVRVAGVVIRAGGEWSYARNDFRFHNTERTAAGIPRSDSFERRVNNDERRAALFGTAVTPAAQITVLASRAERGLVGPMNVRVFDDARGTIYRTLVRVAADRGGWNIAGGARLLRNDYDDGSAFVSRTSSVSLDADAERQRGSVSVRFGGGLDRVHGSALEDAIRPRAFAGANYEWKLDRWRAAAAVRLDGIADAGARLSPSISVERQGAVDLFARAGQGFRAPAFHDLNLVSPQRIDAPPRVRPERVVLDLESGVRMRHKAISLSAALFDRETRDAIVWFPGTFSWSPRNVGRERVYGTEARLTATRKPFDLDLWASARNTALHLDIDGVAVPTPYVPAADGGATGRVRSGRLSVVTSLSAIGRRPTVAIPDPSRAQELPAVTLLDMHVNWRTPMGAADAFASVGARNIHGTRWQQVAGYPTEGRVFTASLTLRPK